MKVAQITTTLQGGAGIAAVRLSDALRSIDVDSVLVSQRLEKQRNSLFSKSLTVLQKHLVQSSTNLVTTFSWPEIRLNSIIGFDILHFHSIYNLTNTKSLLKFAEVKPIVFTLHDQRMFTGGCHYSDKCLNFSSNCSYCPQVRAPFRPFVRKERVLVSELAQNPNVYFISPSEWLAQMAIESNIPRGKISVIRNPISEYSKSNPTLTKKIFGIPDDCYLVGFVASTLNNPLKGLEDLIRAIDVMRIRGHRIPHLLLIGGHLSPESLHGVAATKLSDIHSKHLGALYSAMDLLVVPSRQDNLPNVIAEAAMCGTPVIGSNAGGIPEILRELNLEVVNTQDQYGFADSIEKSMRLKYDRGSISKQARAIFGYEPVARSVAQLYEQILNTNI